MINDSRKSNMDYLYEDQSPIDDYLSIINTEPSSSKYYLNAQNNDPNNNGLINDFNSRMHSFHCSQEKNHFLHNRNNYPLKLIKNNTNSNNHNYVNEFSFWDKNLSSLSINKYKQMRESNNFQTIQNDINTYRNNFLINYTHSINNSIDRDNNKNKTNDFYINKNNENDNEESFNEENIKDKLNKNLKNKIRLDKELINYNILEKKINDEIENKNRQKQLKKYKKYYCNSNTNPIINFNNDEIKEKKRKKIDDSFLKSIKISKKNSQKKLKRKKGEKDDILNNQNQTIKRNTTFAYNLKEKGKGEDNNYSFIKYLKKDNNKLIYKNTIYKQLIDSFFYFINQLSKKYDFKNEIKDINYYLSNANDLSNILIDLEQHLNKIIKLKEEIKEKDALNNNNILAKKIEQENDGDKEEELMTKSKFITINTDCKIKKIENPFSTRNLYSSKKFFTQNNKSLHNNSVNFFNNSNVNEVNINEKNKNKGMNKIIKIRKNNGKLVRVMNKLNFGFFSPNQKNLKNKIIFKNNNMINKNSIKVNESNDLKSIINPKFLKETNNYKYIN